jgi:glycosyltransferase involved in cell wall biosynthesis
VWFVDSGSTDDSVARAAALGADVVRAPRGKGRAIAAALAECTTEYLCFVDGDLEWSERNIPAALRDAACATSADMIVGAFTEARRRLVITPHLYLPLTREFFAEALDAGITVPLSGFRALRASFPCGVLPPGYGVETHLNLVVALDGGKIANCELGEFVGPVRGYANIPEVATDVAAAILDLAEVRGRLPRADRPRWDAWVAPVLAELQEALREGSPT